MDHDVDCVRGEGARRTIIPSRPSLYIIIASGRCVIMTVRDETTDAFQQPVIPTPSPKALKNSETQNI